jgi:hypothetical protein
MVEALELGQALGKHTRIQGGGGKLGIGHCGRSCKETQVGRQWRRIKATIVSGTALKGDCLHRRARCAATRKIPVLG